MKRYLLVGLVICFTIYMFGCRKKEATMEELGEPMSMEALSAMNTTVPQPAQVAPVAAPEKLEALPPAGPYKPSVTEIQTALKNAGLYTGEIDGKIGPMAKKAIEEFQKVNSLTADGKVGPKTWALLSNYLNPPAQTKKKRP